MKDWVSFKSGDVEVKGFFLGCSAEKGRPRDFSNTYDTKKNKDYYLVIQSGDTPDVEHNTSIADYISGYTKFMWVVHEQKDKVKAIAPPPEYNLKDGDIVSLTKDTKIFNYFCSNYYPKLKKFTNNLFTVKEITGHGSIKLIEMDVNLPPFCLKKETGKIPCDYKVKVRKEKTKGGVSYKIIIPTILQKKLKALVAKNSSTKNVSINFASLKRRLVLTLARKNLPEHAMVFFEPKLISTCELTLNEIYDWKEFNRFIENIPTTVAKIVSLAQKLDEFRGK